MRGSLQSRLGTGLIVSLVVLFGLQWLMVTSAIRALTESYAVSRLGHDAENLLSAVLPGSGDSPPSLEAARVDPIYQRPFSGHYYRLSAGGLVLRSRSLWDQDLPVSDMAAGERRTTRIAGPQGQNLLALAGGFEKAGRAITIAVFEDLTPIEAEMRSFQIRYALISAAVLLILILIQRSIVGKGLLPLDKAREDVQRLEEGRVNQLPEDVPAEIGPFIREINRLLKAMSDRIERSRNSLGNLAHALKGPLTLLIQLSEREEFEKVPGLRRDLVDQTGNLRSLLDRELKRARLAGPGRPGLLLSFKEELAGLLEALKKIHAEKRLDCEVVVPDAAVAAGDREDMLELLGNLLDNAFKWAARRIRIEVLDRNGIEITVEDDGPGCPPEDLARLSVRGVRIDEASAGFGLGLSIVKEIVDQYSGGIEFGRSGLLGGFLVRVRLPARRPASTGTVTASPEP